MCLIVVWYRTGLPISFKNTSPEILRLTKCQWNNLKKKVKGSHESIIIYHKLTRQHKTTYMFTAYYHMYTAYYHMYTAYYHKLTRQHKTTYMYTAYAISL